MLLITRYQDCQWANTHIFSRLLNLFGAHAGNTREEKSKQILMWTLDTIGHIVRVYPANVREELGQVFEALKKMLK